jgi:hypothetical protein
MQLGATRSLSQACVRPWVQTSAPHKHTHTPQKHFNKEIKLYFSISLRAWFTNITFIKHGVSRRKNLLPSITTKKVTPAILVVIFHG